MEAYYVFLMGSFIALPAFRNDYGIPDGKGGMVIETSWQSALQMGVPLGAIVGVFIAGPFAAWIGYRWATITGLMLLNAFVFVMFFAHSLAVFFVSQLLQGIPLGIFIALSPAWVGLS
jgi:SP family general alpha glucoside:H+ symporter-like MFS transporter